MTRRTRLNLTLAVGAFLLAAVATIVAVREPTDPLSRSTLQAALGRWQRAGVSTYNLAYRMNGAVCEVLVRDGVVALASVDGNATTIADPRAYTVDGLFDTLRLELDNRDDPAGPFAGVGREVVMRARFNADLGYVERYLRGSAGLGRGATIELIRFTPIR